MRGERHSDRSEHGGFEQTHGLLLKLKAALHPTVKLPGGSVSVKPNPGASPACGDEVGTTKAAARKALPLRKIERPAVVRMGNPR
jgi:hypothetical protein